MSNASPAISSHFMVLIFLLQVIAGIMLLVGRFVPLALIALAAILEEAQPAAVFGNACRAADALRAGRARVNEEAEPLAD